MEWMLMPYRRYADFSGRSRRKEYWMFALLQLIVACVFYALLFAGMPEMDAPGQIAQAPGALFYAGFILFMIFALVSFIPSLAVTVRRLHDQDKSGWWILIEFVPFVGPLILLIFMFMDGTPGPNRFGDDPKGSVGEAFA
ncbi:MAG: DUF805 domain-containing protein [Candidatus Andeanibacterium colombiense]|uniref:DUF805 domain-containing protein n=1 Tax=Candidatus Andeanibacterium colombiense TaxID=3121345 RepID=A0AAJ5X5W6_9SPHN|nr:MAG: DUF805 domain-containing protein [Sphingomonadaceae bacterium]